MSEVPSGHSGEAAAGADATLLFPTTSAPIETCAKCGHDLLGLTHLGFCPECGTPGENVTFAPAPEGHRCRDCGYSLAGLTPTDRCPECGKPAWQSLRGDYLRYASSTYTEQVRKGLTWFLNGVLLIIVIPIAIVLIYIVVGITGVGGRLGNTYSGVLSALSTIAMFVPWCIMAWGIWRYTTIDPSYAGGTDPSTPRRVIRVSLLSGIALFITGFALSTMLLPTRLIGAVIGVLATIVVITLIFSLLLYAKWMFHRIPDKTLSYQAGMYMWLLPTLMAGSVIFLIVGTFVFPLIGCIGIVLVFGSWIVSFILFWNLHDRLRAHLKAIDQHRASSPSAGSYA